MATTDATDITEHRDVKKWLPIREVPRLRSLLDKYLDSATSDTTDIIEHRDVVKK
jgi:hypothetical protein